MAELEAGVLIDGSHSRSDEFDVATIQLAMDLGWKPIKDAHDIVALLDIELMDKYQVLAEMNWEAVDWINEHVNLPEDHYVGIHPEESQLLGVWPLDWD